MGNQFLHKTISLYNRTGILSTIHPLLFSQVEFFVMGGFAAFLSHVMERHLFIIYIYNLYIVSQ